VLRRGGEHSVSNVPIDGGYALPGQAAGPQPHRSGADAYTLGQPHAIIDPAMRTPHLPGFADPSAAVVLLDVVLGYGAIAIRRRSSPSRRRCARGPPHRRRIGMRHGGRSAGYDAQIAKLRRGIIIGSSNAEAAERAAGDR